MSIAGELGERITCTELGALSAEALERTKALVLDQVGCIIGASCRPQARIIAESASMLTNCDEVSIMPFGPRGSRAKAVYYHSYCANLLDADDTFANEDGTVVGHIGSVVIPVGLACAEFADRSGLELASAIAVGYEVAIRMGLAARPSAAEAVRAKGMGTWEILGAAATASRLLGLNARECAHALCIAAVSAPVPSLNAFYDGQNRVAWIKNNLGWASLGGLMAAIMAERGMKGNIHVFDDGEFSLMCASSGWDESLVQGLGQSELLIRQVSLKAYPACWYAASALTAAHELAQKYRISATQIDQITVEARSELAVSKLFTYPSDPMDAPFSIPYLVACSLMGKDEALWHPTLRSIESPEMKKLYTKMGAKLIPQTSNAMPETYTRLTVRTILGDMLVAEVAVPVGSPERPLDHATLEAKFLTLAAAAIGEARARRLSSFIMNLDRIEDFREGFGEITSSAC